MDCEKFEYHPSCQDKKPQFFNNRAGLSYELPQFELDELSVGDDVGQKETKEQFEDYESLRAEFLQTGPSQLSFLLLRRIIQNPKIPCEFRAQPLFRLLVDACNALALNEIEISVWAIFLDRCVWADNIAKLDYVLYYSALSAKGYTNSDISPYLSFLASKIGNFYSNYMQWTQRNRSQLEVTDKELNCIYKKLRSPYNEDLVDYNYYVDDILQMSPPYMSDLKESTVSKDFSRDAEDTTLATSLPNPKNKKIIFSDASWVPNYDFESPTPLTASSQKNSILSPMVLERIDFICSEFLNCEVPKINVCHSSRTQNPLLSSLANL
ncbi:unnamed protein product [Blepharisma stoltei]|uniref:Uncharacterized protein n=1 Tax=Blepharisma stoltei TaxID=1481888 RepID=A0AAU9J8Y0_9CILI|nr:unnamed protein product [Blepharisma stoltei]